MLIMHFGAKCATRKPYYQSYFNDYDPELWSFLEQPMQAIACNIGRVESKGCQIQGDGRDDQVQRESAWRILKEASGPGGQD